jgi:hypothetical protein
VRHSWDVVKLMAVVMRGRSKVAQPCLIFDPLRHQIVSFNLISLKMKHRVLPCLRPRDQVKRRRLVWMRWTFVRCRDVLAATDLRGHMVISRSRLSSFFAEFYCRRPTASAASIIPGPSSGVGVAVGCTPSRAVRSLFFGSQPHVSPQNSSSTQSTTFLA